MSIAQPASQIKVDQDLVKRLAGTVRGLSIDAVQAANSGHPGLPLGAADMAVTLWYYFLRYNPEDPAWPNRDKFILSAGHGSMLLYSLLHLSGYDLSKDEIESFRQWGSPTAGRALGRASAGPGRCQQERRIERSREGRGCPRQLLCG